VTALGCGFAHYLLRSWSPRGAFAAESKGIGSWG
jgi:hypothetical protein